MRTSKDGKFAVQLFAAVAAEMVDRFGGGARCRIRDHKTVHGVRLQEWIGGIEVPAPYCGIGISGFDLSAVEPTDAPVTCARCLRSSSDDAQAPGQLALFDLAA